MEKYYDILVPIIKEAGRMMREAKLDESEKGVKEKCGEAANVVTLYDVAVQNELITKIKAQFPEAVFIAEEKENDAASLLCEYCFIIDPIDGTTNFVHNYRHSAISVGLFSYGNPLFCAVYDPYQDEMFTATAGGGAYLNGNPIKVSEHDLPHALVAFGSSPYYKDELCEKTFALVKALFLTCSDVRRVASAALDLAYLAAGRNDIFFEYRLSPWDIAAGYLLILEAGGIMTDMEGNELDFSKPSSVLAATPTVYTSALKIAKSI